MHDAKELEPGLSAYRAGRYFEAHELWEDRWRAETDPARRLLLQGLIQLAAALHKLATDLRPAGAPALLARSADKLARLSACGQVPFGIDPKALHRQVERAAWVIDRDDGQARLVPPVL